MAGYAPSPATAGSRAMLLRWQRGRPKTHAVFSNSHPVPSCGRPHPAQSATRPAPDSAAPCGNPHWPSVILHVQRILRQPDSHSEMVHNFGDAIERVGEFSRIWPVAAPEAGVIRRDKVIAIGKPGEKRLEHSRGRRGSVQQEKRWRVFRPGLSVEDRESVYLYRAIKSRVFHGTFLSLGASRCLKCYEHRQNHQRHYRSPQESGPTR
jgi:hypothetical protein